MSDWRSVVATASGDRCVGRRTGFHHDASATRGAPRTGRRSAPWVWKPSKPPATNRARRILRAVIKEIVARVTDARIELVMHWQGGDHTELSVVKNRTGQHRWTADVEVQTLIPQLARQLNDASIASLLNRLGYRTGRDMTWTETRVRSFRCHHGIAVYRDGEREERGEVTLEQAARSSLHEQDDGPAHDRCWNTERVTGLQGRTVGHQAPTICSGSKSVQLSRHQVSGPLPQDPLQIPLELQ